MNEMTQEEHQTRFSEEGVLTKFEYIRSIMSFKDFQAILPVEIFISGPHQDGELALTNKYSFGHYNPQFMKLLSETIYEIIESEEFISNTQASMERYGILDLLTRYQLIYGITDQYADEFDKFKIQYIDKLEKKTWPEDGYWKHIPSRLDKLEYWGWSDPIYYFWVRREIDGTRDIWIEIIDEVVAAYSGTNTLEHDFTKDGHRKLTIALNTVPEYTEGNLGMSSSIRFLGTDLDSLNLDLKKPLEAEMLLELDLPTLRFLRNTILAQYGRSFSSPSLHVYFSQKPWYKIRSDYSDELLTDIDKANIALIRDFENTQGGQWDEDQYVDWIEETLGYLIPEHMVLAKQGNGREEYVPVSCGQANRSLFIIRNEDQVYLIFEYNPLIHDVESIEVPIALLEYDGTEWLAYSKDLHPDPAILRQVENYLIVDDETYINSDRVEKMEMLSEQECQKLIEG